MHREITDNAAKPAISGKKKIGRDANCGYFRNKL
jgi:hypothetical protein